MRKARGRRVPSCSATEETAGHWWREEGNGGEKRRAVMGRKGSSDGEKEGIGGEKEKVMERKKKYLWEEKERKKTIDEKRLKI